MILTDLPAEVPQHKTRGMEYLRAGKCVTCGGEKRSRHVYHCDKCYAIIYPAIFDYDDD